MDPSKPLIPEHTLESRIGSGAYGEVWRARTVAGTWRAVKVVHRARFDTARTYEREYAGLQRVEPLSRTHDALVDILQIGRNDADPAGGYFYYVMELADAVEAELPSGGLGVTGSSEGLEAVGYVPRTLATVISKGRRLPPTECAALGVAIAEGLAHLHSNGLVHRDIKPSNLIFVNGRLKLADIGLVSQFESARTFVGTGGYIPPEGPGSTRADIYALGKVLYKWPPGWIGWNSPNFRGTSWIRPRSMGRNPMANSMRSSCGRAPWIQQSGMPQRRI